ncbi:hypothetical protein RDWZM_002152 [Blomia tropicalis]|uniref:Uncharacterized protein n=1 Tax=Blomia tropicalis TaxID=40697 RepID=A0A9Q0MFV3_BLOTA|nr:hypothetical protein RDWZM_002152 [Blomia tropicalis]
MLDEENVIFFYLLFSLGIESIIFIAVTGLLFVALVKKSKYLLLPWLIVASIDVLISLTIAFAELALPNNLSNSSCSLPLISTLVTILVCFIMIYCALIVLAQYLTFASNAVGIAEIKVTPVRDESTTNAIGGGSMNRGQIDHGAMASDTLKVPHVSTPKDAW